MNDENLYYSPEAFNLSFVGEIEWSSGSYEFDLTAVWRTNSGQFVFAEDSGCSCPAPFEKPMLEEIPSLESLKTHLEVRNSNKYQEDRSLQIANLLEKLHQAGLR